MYGTLSRLHFTLVANFGLVRPQVKGHLSGFFLSIPGTPSSILHPSFLYQSGVPDDVGDSRRVEKE